jgi:cyclophilin family peptidyl-prolyl cis-trans isomerase
VHLDANHVVFGYITDGMNLIDKIAAMDVVGKDTPAEPIQIMWTNDAHDVGNE